MSLKPQSGTRKLITPRLEVSSVVYAEQYDGHGLFTFPTASIKQQHTDTLTGSDLSSGLFFFHSSCGYP